MHSLVNYMKLIKFRLTTLFTKVKISSIFLVKFKLYEILV